MSTPDQPDEPTPAKPTNSELSIYDNLVAWYTGKSEGIHWAALVVALLLLIVELVGFIADPPYMMKLAAPTKSTVPHYDLYTPTIWLAGVFTGLILFFVVRYSSVYNAKDRLDNFARNYIFPRWAQHVVLHLTYLTIAFELYLIATKPYTISSIVRDYANLHHWLYWIGGLAASFVVFVITDLKRLPRFVRFALSLWVAILSHMFWWITP